MLAKVKEGLGWSYFQPRHHAYLELSWYFGVFCIISLIFVIWAAAVSDKVRVENLQDPEREQCGKLNGFLRTFALIEIAEMASCFLLTLGLPSIMRSANWAIFGLSSLLLLGLTYLAKLGGLALGMVWVWAETGVACDQVTPGLYTSTRQFLICMIVIYFIQLGLGSCFVMLFGLKDAFDEGVYLYRTKYGSKSEEDENLMTDDEDEEVTEV